MPVTGPGDSILDAIESGKGDDILMKDFKLNADQVTAFRSLYYGLTNKKMKYSEINEYYPELKTFFTGPTLTQTPEAIPKEDFTKPVKQKIVAESTAAPSKQIASQPVKVGTTVQESLNTKVTEAQKKLYEELKANDDVVENMIRTQRYEVAKREGMDAFASAHRTDMPAAAMLAGIRNQVEPEVKPQDLPVSADDVNILKTEIATNEPQARQFVNQIIVKKPDKAKDLQSSMYALDANARLKDNPKAWQKVYDNLQAIEKGELKYNAQTGQLVKELDFFPALAAGVKQRHESLESYKMLQMPKDQVIKIMEAERASYDPDKPVEVPKGAGEIGQMFGTEWAALLKGTATTMATSIVGGQAAAPYISAAINAPEYYKRGFESAFKQTYNELRGQGKSEDEAYEGALKQAKIEGKYDAAEGAISSFIGGRIGIKELPKFNITGGFKNSVKNILSKSGQFAAETTVEGLTDGIIAGYLQDKKNEAAREAGLFRTDDSVKEAITGELTFAFAAGTLGQAGRAFVDPNTYKKLLYWITKQPAETTETKLGEMVMNGELTQEQADNVQAQIKEQKRIDEKIPDDIKDVSRMAMHDKIAKREELEKRLESEDEALHPPIKEEIKKLNEEILEHASHKKEDTINEPEIISNWNYQGEGDAFANNKELREGKSAYIIRVLDGMGTGNPYYRAKQLGELDTESPVRYEEKDENITALDGNGNTVGVVKFDGKGGIEHLAVAPEFQNKGIATELIKKLKSKYSIDFSKSKLISPDAVKFINKLNKRANVEEQQPEGSVAEITTPEPGATATTTVVEGTAAPVTDEQPSTTNEQHWTDPTTGQSFVLRGDQLYTMRGDKEVAFSEKAMQTKNAKDIVERIQQANKPHSAETFIEESAGGSNITKLKPTRQQAAFYESNMGATPPVTGRVMPDPIVGLEPKKRRQIIKDVTTGLKQRLIYAKTGRYGGIGAYLPGFKGIKIKSNNDLDTIAHELGHSIDDEFDLYTKIATDKAALLELDQFASYGSTPPSGHPDPRRYIDKEGFAEWMRAYIINPKVAERMAPKVTALFKQHTNKILKEVIKTFSDDVRILEGSNAGDIARTNIDFDPEKPKGILGQLLKKEETNNEFSITWVNRLAANFTNPLAAFEKAFKYAKGLRGLDEVLPENDPLILSRMLLGIDGKFGEILKTGMINGRGDVIADENGNPMNLDWLLEPMDNTTAASAKKDMEDTILFMVAERTVELSKKFRRGEDLTGIGTISKSDYAVAQKMLTEFYNGNPNRLARIQEAAKRYRAFADATLSYAVDKGRLSQEAFEYITENNEQYVALQRVLETAPGEEITGFEGPGSTLGSVSELLHTIKGSTKTIVNPYIPLLDTLYKTVRESDRNDVLRSFRDLLVDPRYSNDGEPTRYSDIGIIAAPNDTKSETISIFINGKVEKWIFQKDIHEQLKGLDKEAYRLPALLTWPAQALRFFTTHFPTFAVRNWVRDTQDRLIKSTTGSGFANLIGSQEDWHAIARAGGLNSGHYAKSKNYYYGLMTEAISVMAKDKRFILADPGLLKHAWNKYTDLLYKGETSNRVAEYRSAFKEGKTKGMDDYNASLYAAYKARNLIDFAIMGHWMKIINQIIPFSNAAVQGMRSAAYSAQTNFGGFLLKTFAYSIVPGIAAWMWNHRNEEDEKLYEELPGYQRDMFWNFRVGANKWLSIPKPYELAIPQMGIDRLLSYGFADNKNAFQGFGEEVLKLLLPFDEGNIAGSYQTVLEGQSNYDFFRERNIIPVDEDPLNLAIRHTETASRLGQLLQKFTQIEAIKYIPIIQNIADIDARKWDHFLQRQFSYTGTFMLKLSDIGRDDSRHEFDFTDTGLFKRSPAYNSLSVQNMIAYAKEFGLTKTPAYKDFNVIVGQYFNADTEEDREQIGLQLIDHSKELLNTWKAENMDIYKIEAADAKKAARKEEQQ